MGVSKIGLGGGCHWCTEGIFQSLIGVRKVDQGWISSEGDKSSFSEAVIVHFDANVITLETLISIHLLTHSSDSSHSMRDKYRSAVYTFGDDQVTNVKSIIEKLKTELDKKFITQILPFVKFKTNEEQYLNYFYNNPDNTFCQRYIHPKLTLLMEKFKVNINKRRLEELNLSEIK